MIIVPCFRIILRLVIILTNNRKEFFHLNLTYFHNLITDFDHKIQIEKVYNKNFEFSI
jgi:hypothetical protein